MPAVPLNEAPEYYEARACVTPPTDSEYCRQLLVAAQKLGFAKEPGHGTRWEFLQRSELPTVLSFASGALTTACREFGATVETLRVVAVIVELIEPKRPSSAPLEMPPVN